MANGHTEGIFSGSNTLTIKERWADASASKRFRIEWYITLFFAVCMVIGMPHYFSAIQQRQGIALADPVLQWLPSVDLSLPIFIIIYSSLLLVLGYMTTHPWHLLKACQTYIVMSLLRFASIYLVPLSQPEGMVFLDDPILNHLFYQGYVTKDLFFSGHTATMFLFGLVVLDKRLKYFFYFTTAILAVMILIQHVHYTIDVVAAPFFVMGSYKLVNWCDKKLAEHLAKGRH